MIMMMMMMMTPVILFCFALSIFLHCDVILGTVRYTPDKWDIPWYATPRTGCIPILYNAIENKMANNGCNTLWYTTALLYSYWLYSVWHDKSLRDMFGPRSKRSK